MTRYRSADWDAIAAATPNDVTAAKVVGQGGEREPEVAVPPHVFHSDICPPLKEPKVISLTGNAALHELVGKRIGRLTVLGIDASPPTSRMATREARWVVRCDCGKFEHRKAKGLRNPSSNTLLHACYVCQRNFWMQERYKKQGPRPITDFFEPHRDEGSGKGAQSNTGVTMDAIATAWADDAEAGT